MLDSSSFHISPVSEDAIIIRFDDEAVNHSSMMMVFSKRIREVYGNAILDVVPSYSSVVVHYDLMQVNLFEAISSIRNLMLRPTARGNDADSMSRLIRVPVCYDSSFAKDLRRMSQMLEMDESEIIKTHCKGSYQVFAVGFTPGFPYLGVVPDAIACPRLGSPRMAIPAGSVGIADKQTGIYPIESPGGWNIIGRTPLRLLDYDPEPTSPFRSGDRVQFISIDKTEFEKCEGMSVVDWNQIR